MAQHALEMRLTDEVDRAREAADMLRQIRAQLRTLGQNAQGQIAQAISAFDAKALAIAGQGGGGGRAEAGAGRLREAQANLAVVSGGLAGVYGSVSASDFAPTITQAQAAAEGERELAPLLAKWNTMRTVELPALNAQLRAAGLAEVKLEKP